MKNIDEMVRISETLLGLIYKFVEQDKKAQYFGTNTKLYHSEIHMIQFIGENEVHYISGIARKLDITKGAVSQTIKRLEKKEFIIKKEYEDNNSKLLIELTEKGKIAYKNHKKYHEKFDKIIIGMLKDEDERNIKFLNTFFSKLLDII